jgi:hypothetical protein
MLGTFVSRENREDMIVLKELIEAGKLTPRTRQGRHHRVRYDEPYAASPLSDRERSAGRPSRRRAASGGAH